MKHDSIIFDLDGTLWDSSEGVAISWSKVIKELPDIHTTLTIDDLKGVMGMASVELMATLFPHLTTQRGQEVFELMCKEEIEYLNVHGGRLYDGVSSVIPQLAQRVPLFIVSNCNDGYIECFLHSSGLKRYFKDWECIGRSGFPKAENIRLIVERNGLNAPVYVGDTALDMDSSSKAGVPFIWAAYGFGKADADTTINHFEELFKYIY